MTFEWDEAKNKVNIQKHGIDFEDVKSVFNHPMLKRLDTRENYGEDRFIALGMMYENVVVVVYVERRENLRIISARKATKQERRIYEQEIF